MTFAPDWLLFDYFFFNDTKCITYQNDAWPMIYSVLPMELLIQAVMYEFSIHLAKFLVPPCELRGFLK